MTILSYLMHLHFIGNVAAATVTVHMQLELPQLLLNTLFPSGIGMSCYM